MSKICYSPLILVSLVLMCGVSTTAFAGMAPPAHAPLPTCEEEPDEEASFPDPLVIELQSLSRGLDDGTSKAGLGFLTVLIDGYEAEYVDGADQHGHEGIDNAIYGLQLDVEGQAPEGLQFPDEPVVLLDPHDRIRLHWNDSETKGHGIDLTVTATWVDCYGRTGPSSDPLNIVDSGAGSNGCATTGGDGTPVSLLVVLALLLGFHGLGARASLRVS